MLAVGAEGTIVTWEFLLTAFIIVATPGTGAIYTIASGLARGPRAGVLAAFASTLGIVPHIVAALTGLAAMVHASALAFDLLKYAGVFYLLYMAYQMFRNAGPLQIAPDNRERSIREVFRDGIALNLLNPKLSVFFVAFLPLFIRTGDPTPVVTMLELSLAFMLMTFVVFAAYGVSAGLLRREIVSRPSVLRVTQRTFAAAFAGLAVKLALTDR